MNARNGISSVRSRVYVVPTERPEADGTLAWSKTTVVTAEVSAGGETGLGWTYGSSACRELIGEILARELLGQNYLDIARLHEVMVRGCRNVGRPGIAGCAISAVDVALWDLKARLLELPLTSLLGRFQEAAPIYGSGGFTTYDDATLAAQLEHFVVSLGASRVKIKVGEAWGTAVERDFARVGVARSVIGEAVELFVDANGAYSVKQAVRMGRRFEDCGVTWFEEPVSSDDLGGLRVVRDRLSCDIAAGEYGYAEGYFARMIDAGAVDCLQIDATRAGGYTAWLRIAALAAAFGVEVSAHCAPNLHAPVVLAAPNLRHIEYFHDHERVDALLFDGVPKPKAGLLAPTDGLGHGMTLKDPAAYRAA